MVKGMDLHWITKSRLAEDILMDLRISNHLGSNFRHLVRGQLYKVRIFWIIPKSLSLAVLSSPGPRPDDVIISQRHLGATAAIRRHRSQPKTEEKATGIPAGIRRGRQ
ncbi:uncharacterized protein LOC143421385 isoform X2 [Maylandia zebra]|uniref:uncharacterized protein LOC143421385 isoform X2 n=1 Tax=Maylandia zebra TaxID=106582 RepID=UPI00403D1414